MSWIAASLVSIVVSTAMLVGAIIAFPSDYFAEERAPVPRHPALAIALTIAKNLCGLLFVVVGIILSVPGVPGQGLLTIAVGLLMLDLPKKRQLERRLLEHQALRRFMNEIRRRFGRPPMRFE